MSSPRVGVQLPDYLGKQSPEPPEKPAPQAWLFVYFCGVKPRVQPNKSKKEADRYKKRLSMESRNSTMPMMYLKHIQIKGEGKDCYFTMRNTMTGSRSSARSATVSSMWCLATAIERVAAIAK
ncbi:MAG: hypothetical protein ACI4O9_05175 [Akkermansia sp.]